jgi:hypothetical protein
MALILTPRRPLQEGPSTLSATDLHVVWQGPTVSKFLITPFYSASSLIRQPCRPSLFHIGFILAVVLSSLLRQALLRGDKQRDF